MAKKASKVTSEAALRASVMSFNGSGKGDYSSPYNFYRSYQTHKADQEDWAALKYSKESKDWILEQAAKLIAKRTGQPVPKKAAVRPSNPTTPAKHPKNLPRISEEAEIEQPDGYLTMFVDAGTKNNGQKGSQETRIAGADFDGEILFDEPIGDKTNNEGEIAAILRALHMAQDLGLSLNLYSDSQIAVGWTTKGTTGKRGSHVAHLATEAHELLAATDSTLTWAPRELNRAGWHLENMYSI